ncbi:cytochrome p450 79a2 [Raphanus sativus]|nr:cytochrome p450 79a2 [Raphanus sativus]
MLATVDNPSNAVEWAMAEMINQPSIMQKAVEEIDRVVGKDRFVLESDILNLNYVKACVKEAFRLHPVAPFNLLTCPPPMQWWKFEPERHMCNNKNVELNDPDLNLISFSAGRRGCMGSNIGSAMTYMLLARLIQGFTWSSVHGEDKIDISESKGDLFMAKPLHAIATPRLASRIYST